MNAPAARNEVPTLYEWAGGLPRFEQLTEIFYDRVKQDAELAPVFAQMHARHAQFVAQFLAEVCGGPALYSAERGGHATMIRQHLGRHLNEALRQRWMQLLLRCADEAGFPDDPEFRSAFVAYLEWGTRLAVINSQTDAAPTVEAPMPHWGWGETGGPYRG
jgi:hemoglobin